MSEGWEDIQKRSDARYERWRALSQDQKVELALALLRRPERRSDGLKMLQQLYPKAPAEMLGTVCHHAFVDLPDGLLDLMAELELSLREPQPYFPVGIGVEALYHLYNLLQFSALLPEGKAGLEELVHQVKEWLEEGDIETALKRLEELEEKLSGAEPPPDFD